MDGTVTMLYRRGLEAGSKCRCFIGLFIPDHLYQPELEVGGIDELLPTALRLGMEKAYDNALTPTLTENPGAELVSQLFPTGMSFEEGYLFLTCLQDAHDDIITLPALHQELGLIAERFHLSPAKITTITHWNA